MGLLMNLFFWDPNVTYLYVCLKKGQSIIGKAAINCIAYSCKDIQFDVLNNIAKTTVSIKIRYTSFKLGFLSSTVLINGRKRDSNASWSFPLRGNWNLSTEACHLNLELTVEII